MNIDQFITENAERVQARYEEIGDMAEAIRQIAVENINQTIELQSKSEKLGVKDYMFDMIRQAKKSNKQLQFIF